VLFRLLKVVSKRINHLVPAKMSEGGTCVTVYCAVCHAGATPDQDSGLGENCICTHNAMQCVGKRTVRLEGSTLHC